MSSSVFAKLPKEETNDLIDASSESSSHSLGAFDNIVNETKKLNPVIVREDVKPKRGRPRKNMVLANPKATKTNVKEKNKEDELILHLPIYSGASDDCSEDDCENANLIIINKTTQVQDITGTQLFDKTDIMCKDSKSLDNKKLLDEIARKDAIIKNLTEQLDNVKHLMPNLFPSSHIETKTKMNNLKLINIKNGKPLVVDKTDIACWWCTYGFDTMPCFIPEKYINGSYYVFGCFCTFNCAAAYNLNLNDTKVNVRYGLIKKIYSSIYGLTNDIVIAWQRELLNKYGGIMTIEKFRENTVACRMEYKIAIPPMLMMPQTIEEITYDCSDLITSSGSSKY
jgi:hypothetical protein